jgi:ADP-ribosylglycohydrolase
MGMALGDALGAHVEFRPREYLLSNPVTDLVGGGTWGLQPGQVSNFHQIFNLRSFFPVCQKISVLYTHS